MTSLSKTDAAEMQLVLMLEEPGRIDFETIAHQVLGPGEVRIKTLYSGISAGTEMTAFRGSNPYFSKRWNPVSRLFETGAGASLAYPMPAIGYEEVGEVVETSPGVSKVQVGQKIWGAWGHRTMHLAHEDWAAERTLDERIDPINGIFSQIGAIALNAVIDANIHIGEYVAVFGQGVPGLMVTQLARANGAEVIAVDRLASRLDVAGNCGAVHTVNSAKQDAAEAIRSITGGRGADVSIEIAGAYGALHDAIRSTAFNSRVVVSGFFQGEGKDLYLGEEFHHNRIALVCSQIGGVGRGLDHRWDRSRLEGTIMRLIADGRVDFARLISHTFKMAEAQEAFALLAEHPNNALQVVLDMTG